VYQIQNLKDLLRLRRARSSRSKVARNVVLLGLTSFFTDISSEMVATILPLYLIYTLGLSPLQYGVVDGTHQGAAAIVRVAGGFAGDRLRRHKDVAASGYGLSALSRLGLFLFGGSFVGVGTWIAVDRIGKGIRTAPRDALISLSSAPTAYGAAFGVHRALDTAGAMLGPLIAFALLYLIPGEFDAIFIVSLCFAVIGLAVLILFVEGRPATPGQTTEAATERVSLRAAAGLLRVRPFRALALAAGALAVTTVSDGFIYLRLQQRLDLDARVLPLLFVGTAFAFMVLAVPIGRISDRVGRIRVFLGGYAILLLVYAALLLPSMAGAEVVLFLAALGTYYAATDGVLMAVASGLLPESLRGSGLAFVVTCTSVGRLLASVVFGALWTYFGIETAVVIYTAGLAAALPLAAWAIARSRRALAPGGDYGVSAAEGPASR
jgi:MFS family permease